MDSKYYKWVATFLVMIGIFMALLDTTIVNIALPKMMAELDADTTGIQWVIITYMISAAIGMSFVAWLSSVISSKTIYLAGLVIFTLSSLMCGQADSLAQMNVYRIIQGIGEGMLVPIGMIILYEVFPPEELGIAMGVYGFGAALAPAMGPTLGGYITETLHWRWIFYINIPLGVIGTILSFLFLKKSEKAKDTAGPFDLAGFILLTVMLTSLILFLAKGQEKEWLHSDFILYMLITFIISAILYVWWELRVDNPITDLTLFRINPFCLSVTTFFMCSAALYGAFLIMPLYLERLRVYPTMTSGLILLPGGIICALTLIIAGLLGDKYTPKHGYVWGGLAFMSISLFLLGSIDLYTSKENLAYFYWVPVNIAWGFGFASSAALAMGSAPEDKASTASSIVNITRLVAGAVGSAVGVAMLERGTASNYEAFASNITHGKPAAMNMMAKISGYLVQTGISPEEAITKGTAFMETYITANASCYAFQSVFKFYAIIVAISVPFGFFIKFKKGEKRLIALH